MLRVVRRILYPVLGFTAWHACGTGDGPFEWRRYRVDTDTWERRDMTEKEQAEEAWMWAIR